MLLYLFLEIATITMPSIAMAIAGAMVSPVAPDRNSHTASAMQMSPAISLSFLILSTYLPETQAEILRYRFYLLRRLQRVPGPSTLHRALQIHI